jgi:energy-coupling factor transporter ATP-binding protein EcfA2
MTERQPGGRVDHSPAPGTRRVRRLTSLVRSEEPRERTVRTVRRLLRLASAWGPDVLLEVTYGAVVRSGNGALFEVFGRAPASWADDLGWALDGVGSLRPATGPTTAPPEHLLELVPVRSTQRRPDWAMPVEVEERDLVQHEMARRARVRSLSPWPLALHADLADLLQLNVAQRSTRLLVRYRLSGTTQLEVDMLRQELESSYEPTHLALHDYLGSPVRLRAFVGTAGIVPARVRALVAEWGSNLTTAPVPTPDSAAAWSGDALTLAGHAIPHGAALASLRVPAAGSAPFPGMSTVAAPVAVRTLDTTRRRPARPVHLGVARSPDLRRTRVAVDLQDLMQHCFIQGASGSGKSTLLAAIAVGVLDAGGSVTLLDPEGSTVTGVLHQVRAEHASSLRVIRHGTEDLDAPLNLLACPEAARERMVGMFAEMIQRAQDPNSEGMVGPRWKRWFTLLCLAAAKLLGSDATLVSVSSIATDMARVRALATAVQPLDADLAHRLLSEYGRLEGKEATDLISWAISKLAEIISSERARWIFGSGPDGVDVAAALGSGRSLLVDLGAHRLGEPTARAIGATYLLKHWEALGSRSTTAPHVVLVDEAHLFSYGALPKLLVEARKFGVGIVVATQHPGQLTGELVDTLESNTGSFVSLRAGMRGAVRASVRLDGWPAGELVRLCDLTAAATLSRGGVVTPPFTLELDHHARVRRWTRADKVGPHIAELVLAESRATAAEYSDLRPHSDDALMTRVREADPRHRPVDELDSWLVRQRDSSGRS